MRDFTKKALKRRFASLDDFLKRWKATERKQAIIEELEAEGLPLDPIAEEVGKDLDPFDLICHGAEWQRSRSSEKGRNPRSRAFRSDVTVSVSNTSPREEGPIIPMACLCRLCYQATPQQLQAWRYRPELRSTRLRSWAYRR